MGRVEGKVAIITGAARGMGEGDARRLVEEGARVVLTDVLDEQGEAVAAELGANARYRHLDVSAPEQWKAVVEETVADWGGVDVLVNNAGIANGAELHKFRHDKWQQILDVNLTGTFYGCQAVTETMIAAGRGSIINVSSIEGMRGTPWAHGYVAAKWAVRGLTKSVALELAPHGIRCNSLHPGLVRTPITEGIPDDMIPIPLGRLGTVEDVANFVLFLASDESSYATATEFVVDGGTINGIPHKQL
ncbi:glucose 1-dehydrogenase [Dietzia psychralcaliphila]|uniref:3-alpha-hydroxysteroid dehydrogenase n=1 Tax=Dietzia psychralcaliphila TaxID=139021 RepID=A0AAD0NR50_9ACTN|nr:glucose 1-dehydrogenase [Dietzia psychralcaliphila]AWH96824.1 3-alpha-hydroxysteroid dehydrogenase [Dietzia psychralcaliphila]PTM89476.1 3alpha(or 20beta)-hydroxysteroid dehydrogenase [Dietzia psychralcaliphila]